MAPVVSTSSISRMRRALDLAATPARARRRRRRRCAAGPTPELAALARRVAPADQRVRQVGEAGAAGQRPGDLGGLVVAAAEQPQRMQRHRHDGVGVGDQVARARAADPAGEQAGQIGAVGVLELAGSGRARRRRRGRRPGRGRRRAAGPGRRRSASPASYSNGAPQPSQTGASMKRDLGPGLGASGPATAAPAPAPSSACGGSTRSTAARSSAARSRAPRRPRSPVRVPAIGQLARSAARSSTGAMSGPPRLFDRALHRRRLDRAAPRLRGGRLPEAPRRRGPGRAPGGRSCASFPLAVDLGARDGAFARALAASDAGAQGRACWSRPTSSRGHAGRPRRACASCSTRSGCRSRPRAWTWWSRRWPCTGPTTCVGALIQIRQALKPDGLFLGAILGGATLTELRQALIDGRAGAARRRGTARLALRRRLRRRRPAAARRLRPAGGRRRPRHRALRPHPLTLMADLRAMGETNVLVERRAPAADPRRCWPAPARSTPSGSPSPTAASRATFEILTLTGWAPHARPAAAAAARLGQDAAGRRARDGGAEGIGRISDASSRPIADIRCPAMIARMSTPSDAFAQVARDLVGMELSHIWRGHGTALFLEFGKLSERLRKDGSVGNPRGEISVGLEFGWRIEVDRRVVAATARDLWPEVFKGLQGKCASWIELFGEVPELRLVLDQQERLLTFSLDDDGPEWALTEHPLEPASMDLLAGRRASLR